MAFLLAVVATSSFLDNVVRISLCAEKAVWADLHYIESTESLLGSFIPVLCFPSSCS